MSLEDALVAMSLDINRHCSRGEVRFLFSSASLFFKSHFSEQASIRTLKYHETAQQRREWFSAKKFDYERREVSHAGGGGGMRSSPRSGYNQNYGGRGGRGRGRGGWRGGDDWRSRGQSLSHFAVLYFLSLIWIFQPDRPHEWEGGGGMKRGRDEEGGRRPPGRIDSLGPHPGFAPQFSTPFYTPTPRDDPRRQQRLDRFSPQQPSSATPAWVNEDDLSQFRDVPIEKKAEDWFEGVSAFEDSSTEPPAAKKQRTAD